MTTQIPAEVLEVLRGLELTDQAARITAPLERRLYLAVNKALEALGGRWDRRRKLHVFADGTARLAEATASGAFVDRIKLMQFYETPPAVARQLVALLPLSDAMNILEPSAGRGALVRALLAADVPPAHITAVEKDPAHQAALAPLQALGVGVICADFFSLHPGLFRYGAVIMNPPFAGGQDLLHVRRAREFLTPGGALAAIMSPGWTFRQDRQAATFRAWVEAQAHWEWTRLEPGAFKASGTGVQAGLLYLEP